MIYATEPGPDGFRYDNLQEQIDTLPLREALIDFEGPITIEAYTVAHKGGEPKRAIVACLTDDGRRTWGTVEDPAVLDAMMREEFCGRRARLQAGGALRME